MYNKKEIMKKAWELKKGICKDQSFGYCLKAAWSLAKKEVEYQRGINLKKDVYAKRQVNKKTGQCRVILSGSTFQYKEDLKAAGFTWNSDRKCWVCVFSSTKKMEKFVYAFNCVIEK